MAQADPNKFSVYISVAAKEKRILERLRAIAAKEKRSFNWVVLEALERYVEGRKEA